MLPGYMIVGRLLVSRQREAMSEENSMWRKSDKDKLLDWDIHKTKCCEEKGGSCLRAVVASLDLCRLSSVADIRGDKDVILSP